MNISPLVVCLLFLTSCSLPITHFTTSGELEGNQQSKLMKIHFQQWSKPLFAGLIGIQKEKDTLRYILLDSSGITLAQARVMQDGNYTQLKANPEIKKSGLPGFLAHTLQRIYLLQPAHYPCSQTFFFKLCKHIDGLNKNKYLHAGPFTVFDIDYSSLKTVFSQPWLGIQMTLTHYQPTHTP